MIGHHVWSALPRLRAEAESRMTATGTLAHPSGEVLDPVTGYATTTWDDYYTGKLGVQRVSNTADRAADLAGQSVLELTATAKLPLSVAGITPGDRLTVTDADDHELVELPLYVVDVAIGTQMVHRRVTVQTARGRHAGQG